MDDELKDEQLTKAIDQRSDVEQKESGDASFSVTINQEKIAQMVLPDLESMGRVERRLAEEPHQQLQAMLERLRTLPEHLRFSPGITLIVGENGSGKSTLARAFKLALDFDYEKRRLAKSSDMGADIDREAYTAVYRPRAEAKIAWLRQSGLAPRLSRCIEVHDVNLPPDYGSEPEYINTSEIVGTITSAELDSMMPSAAEYHRRIDSGIPIEHQVFNEDDPIDFGRQSNRQTVDKVIFQRLQDRKRRSPDTNRVLFLDEPEFGIAPRRHKMLAQEITDSTTLDSVVIVPTNSIVLFDSDLPRIDMDFPERGIFKPSEFPQDKGIEQ